MSRTLTSKSTLETLKKDAKRWLKALRAGDAKARQRLVAAWPQAPAEAALRDVQHALAREYGLDSWIALKAAIDDLALDRRSRAERIDQVLRHGWDGDVRVAQRILARDPSIAGDSLFTAAICGDVAEVERHLARDPDAARRTGGSRQWTALAYVTYGRLDSVNAVAIARRLLDAGADPNFRFSDGWESPFKVLTGAIWLGEGGRPSHALAADLVELLIGAGAEPYDSQALYNISIVGPDTYWYDILWRHCEAKGDLDKWRIPGEGRLGHNFRQNTLDYLLGNGTGQNHIERAEWLIARGADPNAVNGYTKRPIHVLAQLSGFHDFVTLLERHGARPVELAGVEALQAASLRHDAAAARTLVASAPEIVRDPAPLLAVATFGDAQAVALLLSLGADALAVDPDGISPLHRAAQSGSLAAVDLLLAAGADVDLRERRWGGTPLSWSRVLKQPRVAERLAPLSRDVRTFSWFAMIDRLIAVLEEEPALARQTWPEDENPTLLFCLPDEEAAAMEVAAFLLAHGADPAVRNPAGQTAAGAALKRGLDAVADLIRPA